MSPPDVTPATLTPMPTSCGDSNRVCDPKFQWNLLLHTVEDKKKRNGMGKGGRHPKLQPKGCGGGLLLLALFSLCGSSHEEDFHRHSKASL